MADPMARRYLCSEAQDWEFLCLHDFSGDGICMSDPLLEDFKQVVQVRPPPPPHPPSLRRDARHHTRQRSRRLLHAGTLQRVSSDVILTALFVLCSTTAPRSTARVPASAPGNGVCRRRVRRSQSASR